MYFSYQTLTNISIIIYIVVSTIFIIDMIRQVCVRRQRRMPRQGRVTLYIYIYIHIYNNYLNT